MSRAARKRNFLGGSFFRQYGLDVAKYLRHSGAILKNIGDFSLVFLTSKRLPLTTRNKALIARGFAFEAVRMEHGMQVPLKIKDEGYLPTRYRRIKWIKAAPFLINPRAVLVHRIKSVTTYTVDGEYSHTAVRYWCDNIGRGKVVHDVPSGGLLCTRCEAAATSHGMPSADSLCGHHVHLGHERAVQVCCQEAQNAN